MHGCREAFTVVTIPMVVVIVGVPRLHSGTRYRMAIMNGRPVGIPRGSVFHSPRLSAEEDFRLPTDSAVVSRNMKGWELGVHPIKLPAEFMGRFGPVISNPTPNSQKRQRHALTYPSPGNTRPRRVALSSHGVCGITTLGREGSQPVAIPRQMDNRHSIEEQYRNESWRHSAYLVCPPNLVNIGAAP